jgi:hypothetical protein
MPSVTPPITRRELITRHTMAAPNDVGIAIDRLQMLFPSISQLPGNFIFLICRLGNFEFQQLEHNFHVDDKCEKW